MGVVALAQDGYIKADMFVTGQTLASYVDFATSDEHLMKFIVLHLI